MTTWVKLPTKQTSDRNQLESVKIVFSDFKGKFELENLPSLQLIHIERNIFEECVFHND